ncbi:hypothetical protein SEA_FLUDD_124 [Mycobacterium phage Fludd]|uniref:Uncharacterized protein n=4 Tax=Bixzunavirus TaxID=680114 RepID=A0A7M1CRS3_9CAUD|nr:hypothetical protein HYRO_114 [Mycobacterium phage HyRo]YP_009216376.1 hypothetical protein ALICE_116 [Mycobacterium phage Alice]YP_010057296.1 hypothetical protein KHO59_gp184 [Mycobacterium phage Cane17]AXN53942.1 hypothetical protein SEA_RABINOVISH_121 [Mycobacterium phage Rabinovish]QAY09714.1 hypothetical protein SEA_CHARGIE21_120 [Mycobacterium phage Chargie21]QAY14857.1 hypothetical protein SEA_FLUDD_124 [Mycobacterium phage Fludd]QAY15546.1 hypothetical protein SEA_BASQUIAT_120 [My
MPRIDLSEPYAVRLARQSVRDSLMSHGEECILIHLYHVPEVEDTVPRCPFCFDDVYSQSDQYDCPQCYGTTFDGGISFAYRAWGIFGDALDKETTGKRGVWHPVERTLQTEPFPDMWKRDFVVRVEGWTPDHRPTGVEGIYVFDEVNNENIRTGNHFGTDQLHPLGQTADLQKVSDKMPIYKFPIVGRQFHRFDGRER